MEILQRVIKQVSALPENELLLLGAQLRGRSPAPHTQRTPPLPELAFGEHTLRILAWESKVAMDGFLAACELGSLTLGEDAEHQDYYTVVVHPGGDADRFGVGVCCEHHGLVPQLLLHPEDDELLIGLNAEAVAIRVASRRVRFRVPCPSLFHGFLDAPQYGLVLVLDEVGVTAVNRSGDELWTFTRDVVTHRTLAGSVLHLRFWDEPAVSLDVRTGALL